jgi:NitT/TauT family transport system substrate-binding protein
MLKHRFRSRNLVALAALPLLGLVAACGNDAVAGGSAATGDAGEAGGAGATAETLRLGYFANVTHAAAIVGVDEGFIAEALGDTTLETQVFNAGPAVVEALFAGAIDVSYIGPNPAINAYGQSDGEAIRIIAGATSGGAQLVVRDGIDSVEDLRGTTLATPQLGNTQDVALRAWLTEEGLENSVEGGGDVTISPTPNADTLQLLQAGELDGAWLPEPWASRLVLEAGAEVLLDEADLWPDGRFVTTHLIVRTEFLEEYPGTVEALLRGHVEAVEWVGASPEEASTVVNDGIDALTGQPLGDDVLARSWENLEVTVDPVASSLAESAADAFVAGTADEEVDLAGIYDLSALNAILAEQGLTAVSAGGLGKE